MMSSSTKVCVVAVNWRPTGQMKKKKIERKKKKTTRREIQY